MSEQSMATMYAQHIDTLQARAQHALARENIDGL
ncbi:MAG: Xaa-Pro dipeptidase, partial [Gammaproteobacteria bacterium]